MEKQEHTFSKKKVPYYFDASLSQLKEVVDKKKAILLVDEKVNKLHGEKIEGWRKVIVEGSEKSKTLECFQRVVDELLEMEADRQTVLVGIGGGVVTDLAGFVASVYMRGIRFGFVPSTLLSQVDASIGGKNGVNYSKYKNILGIIRQPDFLLFDYGLLDTLEEEDYLSGFGEVIKYACIWDAGLFDFLEQNRENALARDKKVLAHVVRRCVEIKTEIVKEDEFEGGLRRILNFGHTTGHAIERVEGILHGFAIAKGMNLALHFSLLLSDLFIEQAKRIRTLIDAYQLPLDTHTEAKRIEELFRMDKKREQNDIHFVLLKDIGQAEIVPVPLEKLSGLLEKILS